MVYISSKQGRRSLEKTKKYIDLLNDNVGPNKRVGKKKLISTCSKEIRKTQNEHLIIVCQNLIGLLVVNLKPISYFHGAYPTLFLI